MKPESKLSRDWDLLMPRVPSMLGHESVENTRHAGTPDKSFTVCGINGWSELKVAREPKRGTSCIKLRHWSKLQRDWMLKRAPCLNIFLVVRVGEWDYILNTHEMFNFESIPYVEMQHHFWPVKIGVASFWGESEMRQLQSKLMGVNIVT